jgi:hypothetical protein
MDFVALVRSTVTDLGLGDESGSLANLDSLALLDLIETLERVSRISIPDSVVTREAFGSVQSIANLLGELSQRAGGANKPAALE